MSTGMKVSTRYTQYNYWTLHSYLYSTPKLIQICPIQYYTLFTPVVYTQVQTMYIQIIILDYTHTCILIHMLSQIQQYKYTVL